MAGNRRSPVFTENFVRNLDALEAFLNTEGLHTFNPLLDRLFNDIVPLLRRYPQPGRPFPALPARSREAQLLIRKLKARMKKGDDLREFVVDDYLLLYLLREPKLIFLSIKHHRQLSFDLVRFRS